MQFFMFMLSKYVVIKVLIEGRKTIRNFRKPSLTHFFVSFTKNTRILLVAHLFSLFRQHQISIHQFLKHTLGLVEMNLSQAVASFTNQQINNWHQLTFSKVQNSYWHSYLPLSISNYISFLPQQSLKSWRR
jgi:hypothetical protein